MQDDKEWICLSNSLMFSLYGRMELTKTTFSNIMIGVARNKRTSFHLAKQKHFFCHTDSICAQHFFGPLLTYLQFLTAELVTVLLPIPNYELPVHQALKQLRMSFIFSAVVNLNLNSALGGFRTSAHEKPNYMTLFRTWLEKNLH